MSPEEVDLAVTRARIAGIIEAWKLKGEKLVVPPKLAEDIRKIGLWDDEALIEAKPIPLI